jgi:hypothetical protein
MRSVLFALLLALTVAATSQASVVLRFSPADQQVDTGANGTLCCLWSLLCCLFSVLAQPYGSFPCRPSPEAKRCAPACAAPMTRGRSLPDAQPSNSCGPIRHERTAVGDDALQGIRRSTRQPTAASTPCRRRRRAREPNSQRLSASITQPLRMRPRAPENDARSRCAPSTSSTPAALRQRTCAARGMRTSHQQAISARLRRTILDRRDRRLRRDHA